MTNKSKKNPWPTKKAMEQIYEMSLWGGKEYDFYSGEGSHNLELINPYVNAVKKFLCSFKNNLTVCDLGCGDFNIGKELITFTSKYFAIDIVEKLIHRNKEIYKYKNLEFKCLDISKDNIPNADCIILRQVLQHLSNKEVQQILNKIKNYKYIILTEHLPIKSFIANKDIISGQGIRLKQKSGIDISLKPFNFNFIDKRELLSLKLKDHKGIIVTTLYTLF